MQAAIWIIPASIVAVTNVRQELVLQLGFQFINSLYELKRIQSLRESREAAAIAGTHNGIERKIANLPTTKERINSHRCSFLLLPSNRRHFHKISNSPHIRRIFLKNPHPVVLLSKRSFCKRCFKIRRAWRNSDSTQFLFFIPLILRIIAFF